MVIDQLNHIGITEVRPSLLKFYDQSGNPVGDDDTNILVVDEVPYITLVDGYTGEYPQDKYDTTDVYIWRDEQQGDQEEQK